jgi:hypothetical protein
VKIGLRARSLTLEFAPEDVPEELVEEIIRCVERSRCGFVWGPKSDAGLVMKCFRRQNLWSS